ncbi:MAG: hypothetical protein R3324_08390 [Halobacteriales archaeon]|nr:hypothetical protein [Halobacteriales archaeon]
MALPLTMACTDYEWLEPLVYGEVEPENVDLTVFHEIEHADQHIRMINGEFDVAEFSLGTYIAGWPHGWEFTAIPVFPRRFFPHSRVFVNAGAGIEEPADLEGKRVGIVSFQNTLALWFVGIFVDRYDLDLESIDWCTYGTQKVPEEVPYETTTIDRANLPEQLANGEIDAVVNPRTGPFYPLDENVERLFDDLPAAERDCYEATGYYPLMHTVVVRNALLEEHPWLGTELAEVFRRSHDRFAARCNDESLYPLVWWQHYREQEQAVFGDIWGRSFSLAPNRDELETMIRYAYDRGLIERRFQAEEMFA